METMNIQCGHCRQVMAVSTAHLGMRVHCPHCQQIVQLPGGTGAPAPAPAGPGMQDIPQINVPPPPVEPESIFTGPEEGPTDDVFGAPQRLVEMPAGPGPAMQAPPGQPGMPEYNPPYNPYGATDMYNQPPEVDHQGGLAGPAPFPPPADGGYAEEGYHEGAAPATADAAPPARPRARAESMKIPILLIFLIPYSVIATGFIAWLLYQNSKRFDPLLYLADPDKNPPVRPKHDAAVPQGQKIKISETVAVGDLEVTPLKVEMTPLGELALHLKMRNKSQDLRFNPMPQSFLDFNPNIMTARKPYTFLETASNSRFYGGNLDYMQGNPAQGPKGDGALSPGQEMIILVNTRNDLDSLRKVKELAPGRMLWRVQVRRGLMAIRGKDVSVTTVIGVEFDKEQIQRPSRPAS